MSNFWNAWSIGTGEPGTVAGVKMTHGTGILEIWLVRNLMFQFSLVSFSCIVWWLLERYLNGTCPIVSKNVWLFSHPVRITIEDTVQPSGRKIVTEITHASIDESVGTWLIMKHLERSIKLCLHSSFRFFESIRSFSFEKQLTIMEARYTKKVKPWLFHPSIRSQLARIRRKSARNPFWDGELVDFRLSTACPSCSRSSVIFRLPTVGFDKFSLLFSLLVCICQVLYHGINRDLVSFRRISSYCRF